MEPGTSQAPIMISVRALFVAQTRFQAEQNHDTQRVRFEQALDSRGELLRRAEDAVVCVNDSQDLVEFRCAIDYGPVRIMSAPRLQVVLARELAAVAVSVFGRSVDCAVFNVESSDLTLADVTNLIANLTAAADDVNIPLKIRQQRAKLADRLAKSITRTASNGQVPRPKINWIGDPHLQIIKMLAWTIRTHESAGRELLWMRVHELSESVIQTVLGEHGVPFASICERYPEITPAKLMGRADHTERYGEFNLYREAVERAYAMASADREPENSYTTDDVDQPAEEG